MTRGGPGFGRRGPCPSDSPRAAGWGVVMGPPGRVGLGRGRCVRGPRRAGRKAPAPGLSDSAVPVNAPSPRRRSGKALRALLRPAPGWRGRASGSAPPATPGGTGRGSARRSAEHRISGLVLCWSRPPAAAPLRWARLLRPRAGRDAAVPLSGTTAKPRPPHAVRPSRRPPLRRRSALGSRGTRPGSVKRVPARVPVSPRATTPVGASSLHVPVRVPPMRADRSPAIDPRGTPGLLNGAPSGTVPSAVRQRG